MPRCVTAVGQRGAVIWGSRYYGGVITYTVNGAQIRRGERLYAHRLTNEDRDRQDRGAGS
jgi:hypothetical protein